MSAERDALREQLAALMHTQWSGWMRYMVSRCVPAPGVIAGALVIPAEWMERWQRQINTAYADLPEHDKESDRAEADRVLALLPRGERDALCAALVQEYANLLARRDHWRMQTWTAWRPPVEKERSFLLGAQAAMERVAARLDITDLHERATAALAAAGQQVAQDGLEDQEP